MGRVLASTLLLCSLLLLFDPSLSHPSCIDSRAPFTLNATLTFCPYNGTSCCDSNEDLVLQKQLAAMNISDPGCASVMKSILCARCDPFSAELFTVASVPRTVPLLCNSTVSANSSQSNQAANNFCSRVWDTCRNVSLLNSPFAPSLKGQAGLPVNSKVSVLTQYWQSEADFCKSFGGESTGGSVCFDGQTVTLNNSGTPSPPHGMCLEKIANGSYLAMAPHPDGSNRAFFANQPGVIWLATIPDQGAGGTLQLDESNPFVDLSDEVHFDTEFGMMGIAFHPNFAQNGRFFASFNCDKVKWPGCSGRCSCNSDVNCDPSKLGAANGAQPCQYQSVVAEYTVNGTSTKPSLVHKKLKNLIFGVTYSIPADNPYKEDTELQPEIWAYGLRNPWRCSFDAERPSYLMCGDVGQDRYEEVDLITKDGNYGWRVFEGPLLFNTTMTPGENATVNSLNLSAIFPVMGYFHSDVNNKVGSAAITGGYFYRSTTDPCINGRYLYADLYATSIWTGIESPEDSGKFNSSLIPFSCAADSPLPCTSVQGSSLPALGYIFSFGEDNNKDIYLLTSSGVYRIVSPSRCNYTCTKENVTSVQSPAPTSAKSRASQLSAPCNNAVLLFCSLLLILLGLV
ncbi:HIPL1 protein [Morella rubra]|uniref:HIPL1 protein n=1 Tax=Morella rubra TaxID=262757 RepID=A0A6A1VUQ7_9ROSI|nr:HIPL1 protein [Morella rubra]